MVYPRRVVALSPAQRKRVLLARVLPRLAARVRLWGRCAECGVASARRRGWSRSSPRTHWRRFGAAAARTRRFGHQVGPVAVRALRAGLAGVPGLRVHQRDHAVRATLQAIRHRPSVPSDPSAGRRTPTRSVAALAAPTPTHSRWPRSSDWSRLDHRGPNPHSFAGAAALQDADWHHAATAVGARTSSATAAHHPTRRRGHLKGRTRPSTSSRITGCGRAVRWVTATFGTRDALACGVEVRR